MAIVDALVLMGPPGSGKSFLGRRLRQSGVASYVELEPILVDRFGQGAEFASNKQAALELISQSYTRQLESGEELVVFESTGISDRSVLESLMQRYTIEIVKICTPKDVCLSRIASRKHGSNLTNDRETNARLYDYWYDVIEPTYAFSCEVDGTDAEAAVSRMREAYLGLRPAES
jgi:predicted kinase